MAKLISRYKFRDAMDVLFRKSLIINAFVHTKDGSPVATNWGDDINFEFIKLMSGRRVSVYFENPIAMKFDLNNYLCIGSTINYLCTPNTQIWGAGVIDPKIGLRTVPKCVHAVRGPLTREYLNAKAIECPDVFGDPALLLPYFYKPTRKRNAKDRLPISIIPHCTEYSTVCQMKQFSGNPLVKIINMARYDQWTDVVDEICDSKAVFSSSLHGLIVAEAFGIPNYWLNISSQVIGDGFKYRDYFLSIGKHPREPIVLTNLSGLEAHALDNPWTKGTINLQRLMAACPFGIKDPLIHEHPLDL